MLFAALSPSAGCGGEYRSIIALIPIFTTGVAAVQRARSTAPHHLFFLHLHLFATGTLLSTLFMCDPQPENESSGRVNSSN